MWDMGREDETLIATSGMGSDSHREPVTKVTALNTLKWIQIHIINIK